MFILKNVINKIKEFFLNLFYWLKEELKDKRTFIIFLIVTIMLYFPVWGGYLLYFIFRWKWCLGIATFMLAFWFGPVTPFFPLAIAITLSIKKILKNRNKL